jgi:hypothetical protein
MCLLRATNHVFHTLGGHVSLKNNRSAAEADRFLLKQNQLGRRLAGTESAVARARGRRSAKYAVETKRRRSMHGRARNSLPSCIYSRGVPRHANTFPSYVYLRNVAYIDTVNEKQSCNIELSSCDVAEVKDA